ncbi:MAG: glycosyltransferase [Clostridia bacterium]|jgi:mannosyltransferase OCH1-like enzyme|nr:glycosyltransferase [Clostridia bacterium]
MIPKKVHYIWLGGKPKDKLTEICLLTWKDKMPEYEFIEWNETNLDLEKISQENEYFAECRKRNLYAFMADYLRIKILYEQGGIYIDTDVQAIKSLNPLLDRNLILGYEECTIDVVKKQIGTGFIAAERGHWFIEKIYNFYKNEIMNSEMFIIPVIMTDTYNKLNKEEKEKIEILPKEYFSPYDSGGGKLFSIELITKNTYAIHWFSYSWGNYKNRKWALVKHIKNPLKRRIQMVKNRIKFYKETQTVKKNRRKN